MSSAHLIDPELRPLLEVFPDIPLTREILPQVRNLKPPKPQVPDPGVTLERRKVPGPGAAPEVELYIYRPQAATTSLPCIYHIHGGGFVAGSADTYEPLHLNLSAQLQCVLVSVEYRLAPETVFPGAVEDCYAGLAWVFRNAQTLGVDTHRVGVMGESAGGGLAAALALLARDRAEYPLSFQHLIYPMLDDRTCSVPERHPFAGEFVWSAVNNRFGWTALLGCEPGVAGISAYAAPARAENLAGLPSTFISVGALDLFIEEDIEYARRLLRAGVPVELRVYPGATHAFDLELTPGAGAQVGKTARRDSIEALGRALRRRPAP